MGLIWLIWWSHIGVCLNLIQLCRSIFDFFNCSMGMLQIILQRVYINQVNSLGVILNLLFVYVAPPWKKSKPSRKTLKVGGIIEMKYNSRGFHGRQVNRWQI
uniref:Putative ovule protein n=1 Tax=Solanum chacoense TaxID=4108 RepID=A0A0V0HVU8_SOLCH